MSLCRNEYIEVPPDPALVCALATFDSRSEVSKQRQDDDVDRRDAFLDYQHNVLEIVKAL